MLTLSVSATMHADSNDSIRSVCWPSCISTLCQPILFNRFAHSAGPIRRAREEEDDHAAEEEEEGCVYLSRVSESSSPSESRGAKTLFLRVGRSVVETKIVPKSFEEEQRNDFEEEVNQR